MSEENKGAAIPLNYPVSKMEPMVDTYHGTPISDPYGWLEDLDSPETKKWVKEQQTLTRSYLDQIPERKNIQKRLEKLWNYERFGIPFQKGGRTFFFKNDGLQNQAVLYTLKNLDLTPDLLFDPNKLSEDGTTSLAGLEISPNGKFLAYGLSEGGSDWQTWKVLNIETGKEESDQLEWIKFSGVSWSADNLGFYYCRYDKPEGENKLKAINFFHKLYYHKLGDPQEKDTLIYHRPDHKEWGFSGEVSDGGHYLFITVWKGTERKNLLFFKDLRNPESKIVEMIPEFKFSYTLVGTHGHLAFIKTDDQADRNRVISIDLNNPQSKNWQEIIPQSRDTLSWVNLVHDRLFTTYLEDGKSSVKVFDFSGELIKELPLPGYGTVAGFNGSGTDTETFYSFTSFTRPPEIYHLPIDTLKPRLWKKSFVPFDPDDYETRQVFFKSKDGTWVPMFITHKKGIELNRKNPTFLYGYGGFNITLLPQFSVSNLLWMEMGGIYVQVNLRGGGLYGKEWHLSGTRERKQNVFDDFIGAAEWLIANKYTQPDKLAIAGGSNGGLLVGACLTQRPELFGAAIPDVGVMDMLRYQKFTIGWAWASDYGTSDEPESFSNLLSYSPLHNLKEGTQYPATLVVTADVTDLPKPQQYDH